MSQLLKQTLDDQKRKAEDEWQEAVPVSLWCAETKSQRDGHRRKRDSREISVALVIGAPMKRNEECTDADKQVSHALG